MNGGFRSSKLAVVGFRLFFLGINRWACWAPMVPATLRAESLKRKPMMYFSISNRNYSNMYSMSLNLDRIEPNSSNWLWYETKVGRHTATILTAVLRSMLFASSSSFFLLHLTTVFLDFCCWNVYSIVYVVYVLETRLKSKRIFMGSVHDGGDIRFVLG